VAVAIIPAPSAPVSLVGKLSLHPRKSNSWSGSRTTVGAGVGVCVGAVEVGYPVGSPVGSPAGLAVGASVGFWETVGTGVVGTCIGTGVGGE
jgi:hypothetical protein